MFGATGCTHNYGCALPPVEQTATVGQHTHGIRNAERKSINRFAGQALFKKLVIGSESAATPP